VSLVARRVVFSSLEIERVELRSDAIDVQVGNLLRGRAVQLDHPFNIEGTVVFSAGGLGRSLCTPHWRPLGDQLVDGLLGLTPLQSVSIERDRLVLQAQEHRCETIPRAVDGHLELCGEEGRPCVALPADPNITIEDSNLVGGLLQLQGRARVSP
jgi:hypothetical protein